MKTSIDAAELPGGRLRVALVDDEAQLLSALQRQLEGEPISIETFNDSPRAAEVLSREEFALIVSDNIMPQLTGLDLFRRVMQVHPASRRILLTGQTDLNHAVEAFNAGVIHSFMHKPWAKDHLIATVRKELATYRAGKQEQREWARLEEVGKLRGARLVQTIKELKQTKTQLSLLEDTASLGQIDLSPGLRAATVLVVESHDPIRELIVNSLKQLDLIRTIGAADASGALEYLRNSRPVNFVLCDWTLPDMDGLAFLRLVRENGTLSANAAFILMASIEQKAMIEMAMRAGIRGYLIKPFHMHALVSQLENLVGAGSVDSSQLGALQQSTFLIANSHPYVRDQIEQLLATAGIRSVVTATLGLTAVRLLQERRPDCIIYDVNVLNPDWEQLRVTLAQMEHPPALLITGVLATQEDWRRLRNTGESNFLPGPFRQKDLIEAVLVAWSMRGG